MRRITILAAVLVGAFAAPPTAAETKLLVKAGDWVAYAHEQAPERLCFALAEPKEQTPPGAARAAANAFVSAWPREGVRNEVSIHLGGATRKGSDVTVTIDSAVFKLFVRDDRAFVADPTQELKLVEAMKKGSAMVVDAITDRGLPAKDVYSLRGIAQALQAVALCK